MAIWDHEQVLTSNKEVAVEFGDLPTSRHTDSHHSLPSHVSSQDMNQLRLELQEGTVHVELRVVVDISTSVPSQRGNRSQIDIRLRRQEHLDSDLCASQLGGQLLVAISSSWPQELNLAISAKQTGIVPRRLQGQLSNTWNARTEDQELATNVLHGHEGALDRRAQARLVHLCFAKNGRQRVQEVENSRLTLSKGHQNVIRQGQEEVLQI
mmetsp:Transcript_29698/g.53883  ORF Transcript_29698/g.53883 Transcript_29698/m.53883 type:complete len:210 (-) Transcript_29698:1228-1857(-)